MHFYARRVVIATARGFLADLNQAALMGAFHLVAPWFIGLGLGRHGNRWLARQPGISRQSVNAIETGRYDPSLPQQVIDAFPIAVHAIFF